jgi:DNA-directed RNA polymerase subunit M/transcription elongation factor TFIIS
MAAPPVVPPVRTRAVDLIGVALEEQAYLHRNKGYELIVRRLYGGQTLEEAIQLHLPQTKSVEFHDGINTCARCGSHKILDQSLQTKSADEAMTHFFHCTQCHHKWKV